MREYFGKQTQTHLREQRMRLVTEKTEKREKKKRNLCPYVDSNGYRCTMKKMQKEGATHCYKHRQK